MTRKALRKKRRLEARRPNRPAACRSSVPWLAVGALVGTTLTLADSAAASPRAIGAAFLPKPPLERFFDARREAPVGRIDDALEAMQAPGGERYDIPAGPLSEVLAAFQRISGTTVTLSLESIGGIQSPGVRGVFTSDQALQRLLEGTSLRSRRTSAASVTIDVDVPAESVDVSARAATATVDSPKYNLPLRDIPQTIDVIPRAAMEAQGVTTLSEAMRNVPGITLQAGEGGGASNTAGDMFNMRGFNAANSLFVDGVRDDGLISRDVFNLEQIEVFMGPTGSDVGRGTAAGYVNLSTKAPHIGVSSSGLITIGSADQRRATVDVNQPLSSNPNGGWLSKSAFRLNALWQDSGMSGRDFVSVGSKAIAPSLAMGLGTPTRVTVAGQLVRQDNVPDYGIPGAAWLEEPLTPTTILAPAPVDQTNYYGSLGYDYDHGSQESALARVEHDVNTRLTVRNQTRVNRAHREAVISTIQNPAAYNAIDNRVTIARQGNDRENTIVSNQTSLSSRFSTGTLGHNANGGVEYASENQFAPTLAGLGTRNPVDIFNPNPNDPVAGYAIARSGASTTGATSTIALYGFDAINFSPRVQLSGGVRWEHYDTDFSAVDATGVITSSEQAADGLLSGKAGVVFRLNAQGNAYVSYGSTATPPGTANFTLSSQPNNQNNPATEPQRSTNYEVGTKWDLAEGRLLLQAAVFHTVNKNVIFTIDATAIPPLYNQDDEQIVDGVSVGATGRITPQWQVITNCSWLNARLGTQNTANDGNRLTLTPEWSGSIWSTYTFPHGFTIGGGLRATDDVFINAANTIKAPGYGLVDALAEYRVNAHLTLRVNVTNLTNEVYIRNVNNNGGRYNPGNPRSAQVTSAITF
jgi:catecholate siderophore receptor